MSNIFDAALGRLQPLPDFAPGASLPQKLRAGRDAAEARLRKYVPAVRFNEADAKVAIRTVESWQQQHQSALADELASGTQSLPQALALRIGPKMAQDFIVAGYVVAAAGLGPWLSGQVSNYAARRIMINDQWARDDAAARLRVFGVIVKLDDMGELQKLFQPQAMSGFGLAPGIIALIAIAVAIVVAGVVVYLLSSKQLDLNNQLTRDMCERAQREKNEEQTTACINAASRAGIAQELGSAIGAVLGKVVLVGAIGAGVYLAIPLIERKLSRRGAS